MFDFYFMYVACAQRYGPNIRTVSTDDPITLVSKNRLDSGLCRHSCIPRGDVKTYMEGLNELILQVNTSFLLYISSSARKGRICLVAVHHRDNQ